jgi:general secretion pathway protein N
MERGEMRRALHLVLALLPFAPVGADAQNPLDGLRLEDLTATRDRPLFAPTRRPPPPPVRVEAPTPEAPPADEKAGAVGPPPFDLVGAVVGNGEAFALLRNKATSKVVRLRPGDDADGWRVGAIGVRSVALERDGREESLALAAPQPVAATVEVAGEPGHADSVAAPPPAGLNRVVGWMRRDR